MQNVIPVSDPVTPFRQPTFSAYQAALTLLGQHVMTELPLTELYQKTIDIVAQVLGLEYGRIWQLLSDGHSMRLMACVGESLSCGADPSRCLVVDVTAQTAVQQLIQTQQPVIWQQQSRPQPIYALSQAVESGILVLIGAQDQPLGLLSVYASHDRQFTTDEINFLQSITYVLATAIQRQRSQSLIKAQTKILELVACGAKLPDVLGHLCLLLEQELPNALCSILLADTAQRRLGNGVGPSLDQDYAAGLEGLMFGPCAGSCGTAAYRHEPVLSMILRMMLCGLTFVILP
ncbi:MAG: GAF domain-containing protein [Alkalinema sp. RL_2_19]|nr:GAF domain-containing protein [Alkalinema sp. RL_2_19]